MTDILPPDRIAPYVKSTIQRVATTRQKKHFLEFPWALYKNDPNWIPPLRGNQKELVGYKPHPFYARNAVQTFLAYRGGEVCGRIAAILNEGHIHHYNDRRGFFGFFDCADDQEPPTGCSTPSGAGSPTRTSTRFADRPTPR